MITHTAQLRYLHIAPRKVRLLVDTLRRLPVAEAEAQLTMRSQRAALPLLKLIRSAVAGALEKKANRDHLMISEFRVDQGPILKRSLPRAQGRATPIHKITSHVTLTLQEVERGTAPRFLFVKREKKKKKESKAVHKPKQKEEKEIAGKEVREPGFFKKVFRRKLV